jgi:hypothetical protein
MGDLFSTTEPAKPKKKIFYKGKGGKFSDKETARITAIEAENARLKVSNEYHKRQAERLAGDYREEHAKVLELKSQIKRLTTPQSLYEQTNLQQQKVSAS